MTDVCSSRRYCVTGHAYRTLRTFTASVLVPAKELGGGPGQLRAAATQVVPMLPIPCGFP